MKDFCFLLFNKGISEEYPDFSAFIFTRLTVYSRNSQIPSIFHEPWGEKNMGCFLNTWGIYVCMGLFQ